MKTRITKAELAQLIKNEVRKIVGEDSLMAPPELGEPNYLNIDGPAVPMGMGYDEYEDDTTFMPAADEPCPGCGQSPCIDAAYPLNEGSCGCSDPEPEIESHPVDKTMMDVLANPMPCSGCGEIHSGGCGDNENHHNKDSYMSKPQLAKIAKYANKLLMMIDEGEQIQDWQESKIAQMSQMIGDVYHSIEYKKHKGEI